jgi:predicted nucleic acid-binding protein
LLVLDANVWIAAFDPADGFHVDSVTVFKAAGQLGLPLAGPSYVILESVCALARRVGDSAIARAAGEKMAHHPALYLEPVAGTLLAEAEQLGVDLRLRGADAIYAATAARLRAPLLSWDSELVTRAGALSPRDWLAANVTPESVSPSSAGSARSSRPGPRRR